MSLLSHFPILYRLRTTVFIGRGFTLHSLRGWSCRVLLLRFWDRCRIGVCLEEFRVRMEAFIETRSWGA